MKRDTPLADQVLIDWVAQNWTPTTSDPDVFVGRLASVRRRRMRRNDLLGVLAVAAAMLVFVSSTAASNTTSPWLDSTSFAEVSKPVLSADLIEIRRLFLLGEQVP